MRHASPSAPYLAAPFLPDTTLTQVDVAFPASVRHLMPRSEDIPKSYPRQGDWFKFQALWFYKGLSGRTLIAKPDIDLDAALRHLSCINGSFEPKHQDKVAAVAFLASLWLDEAALK